MWVRSDTTNQSAFTLNLDRSEPVFYVLQQPSVSDLAVLDRECTKAGLPRPVLPVAVGDLTPEPETLCVVAGAQHPMANAMHLSWEELQDMTWVLQQHPSPMRTIINQAFHNARVDIPSSIVETTSIMTLLSLLQQTDMIGVTPVSVVNDYPGKHLLKVLPITFVPRLPPYGLITRRHRIQSSAMQAFIDAVKGEHATNQDASMAE
ncbi:hypothetical protein DNK10_01635 [Pseudomonas daroniae]|nr:hypothetical protein DNK10_01635 [Pseudomonas daroniae]